MAAPCAVNATTAPSDPGPRRAGNPVGAAAAFEALLADLRRIVGPDHPDTLIARSNLAGWGA